MRSIGIPELFILSVVIGTWLIPAALAGVVAAKRGGSGWVYGLIGLISFSLSPIVLILAFVLNKGQTCPYCRSSIHPKAVKCPHCQSDLTIDPAQTQA